MNGVQCDNCRAFNAGIPLGWLFVEKVNGNFGGFLAITGPASETFGTFCSVKCLAEYTYVVYATEGKKEIG